MTEALKPLWQMFFNPPREWHPWAVHFPVVFYCLEGVCLFFQRRFTAFFLRAALVSTLIAMIFGIHDAGGFTWRPNLGATNQILIQHVWVSLAIFGLGLMRFLLKKNDSVRPGWAYLLLFILGFWCLVAAGYTGGIVAGHDNG